MAARDYGEARCAVCGKTFTKAIKTQIYCCRRCNDAAFNARNKKDRARLDDGLTPLERKMRRSTVTVDSYIPVRRISDSM